MAPKNGKPYQSTPAPIKVSVPLPREVHMAVAMAHISTGKSNSSLIVELVKARFANGDRSPLRELKPPLKGIEGEAPTVEEEWKRVSVFLAPHLKERATREVQRQHGAVEDKRATGSLAAAIAALVAQAYTPEYKF
jgi:hypothetical protein